MWGWCPWQWRWLVAAGQNKCFGAASQGGLCLWALLLPVAAAEVAELCWVATYLQGCDGCNELGHGVC
jgi:hypothetical protein